MISWRNGITGTRGLNPLIKLAINDCMKTADWNLALFRFFFKRIAIVNRQELFN
jgi:hypothetical protein